MMRVVDYKTGALSEPCLLLFGYFDGMHVGHRTLLARAKEIASERNLRVGIMTFYDSKNGGQIYTFDERLYLFESLGIDFVYAARFDESFRSTEGRDFLGHTAQTLQQLRACVCGTDFTFGREARCGAEELRDFCAQRNIEAVILPLVRLRGEKAAASLAKQYLAGGEAEKLAELLGDKYFIRGEVATEGRRVGRTIGFPTANIHLPPEKYPLKAGVYAVSAEIGGRAYRGIANYGSRPTFGDGRTVLEVYFDGFAGDLYGQMITVYFDSFIREIRKFGSAEELSEQLKKDLEKIR